MPPFRPAPRSFRPPLWKHDTTLRLLSGLATLAIAASSHAAPPRLLAPDHPDRQKLRGALPVVLSHRPAADGSRRWLAPAAEAAVVIRLRQLPDASMLRALRGAGARVPLRTDGSPRGRGRTIAARVTAGAVARVAALDGVERLELAGAPFGSPPPLDGTVREIEGHDAWRAADAWNQPFTGAGVTVCDVDTGVDVFHPMLFRADGGTRAWIDEDGSGDFSPGIDTVDAAGDGLTAPLRVIDGYIVAGWSVDPLQGSGDPGFAVGMDWLYADLNGNGLRDFGRDAGYDDATPSFGEPLYVADDVNDDGVLDPGEKLVALGSSKIALVRVDDDVYRRGDNLIDAPRDEHISHGTASAGVMVGGQRGFSRKVGVAPDADLIMVSQRELYGAELELSDFCIEEGARVVLHEYAPWVGYHLDGSSALERFIDRTTLEGVAHVNPAGNLAGAAKLYKRAHPAGTETAIEIDVPADTPYEDDFRYLGLSLLWRDPSRELTARIEDPSGFGMDLPASTGWISEEWRDGLYLFAQRDTSSRSTVKLDVWIWSDGPAAIPVPTGTWLVRLSDPAPASSPPVEVIAFVADDLSNWSQGIYFPAHVSEDHLIGYPGTADYGIAIAATTGHGYWPRPRWAADPGERAPYSGRGHRIDGLAILDIAAPDDPVTSDFWEGYEALYSIYGGTSGASPHVAGAAALLVQADPSRDGAGVRQAIRDGALVDEVVGTAPNDDFGYGKLRIYRSLFGSEPPAGSPPELGEIHTTVPVGRVVRIPVDLNDPEGAVDVTVEIDRDYDGLPDEQLADDPALGAPFFEIYFDEPGLHVLRLQATDPTGRQDQALAFITAETWRFLEPSGGCACTSARRHPSGPDWLAALGLLGLLTAWRRRRWGTMSSGASGVGGSPRPHPTRGEASRDRGSCSVV